MKINELHHGEAVTIIDGQYYPFKGFGKIQIVPPVIGICISGTDCGGTLINYIMSSGKYMLNVEDFGDIEYWQENLQDILIYVETESGEFTVHEESCQSDNYDNIYIGTVLAEDLMALRLPNKRSNGKSQTVVPVTLRIDAINRLKGL